MPSNTWIIYTMNETISARTYNSYLKLGRSLFNWAKEKCYTKENPFEQIKTKPKTEKKRIIIPPDVREKITSYLLLSPQEENYLIALKLIFNTLLRQSEIKKIKIENVDLENKRIIIPSSVSKNKKQRIVVLTDDVVESLKKLNLPL